MSPIVDDFEQNKDLTYSELSKNGVSTQKV